MNKTCLFCHHTLSDRPEFCPRCGAAIYFTADISALGTYQKGGMVVLINYGVDDGRHLVVVWNQDEKLSATQVAGIIGVQRENIYKLLNSFPGAYRKEPTRPRHKKGVWVIPRWAVYEFLNSARSGAVRWQVEEKQTHRRPNHRLMKARQAVGLTQQELAKELGISQATVSAWERLGALPDADIRRQVGEILQIGEDELWN